ncbi:uncharacterized protein F5147DRAFT_837372 [Suillus discolor]|uniref:DUF6533 domain-containing protein n=1 Tax=Suillus discolor TaxID=1912936 RepID=A0A9P7F4Z0_9AGAM|nr:uncharacterized protein F5147DRAFT_837372 [Suillus discolor]KAG2107445.1 hypothetical protein F5147DRAFT_837372 [Suillus discolor]
MDGHHVGSFETIVILLENVSSTLAADSIRPPTTPSAVSDLIEEVYPAFSIANRAKTRTRKTQVKKPTYEPVNHDVIELTSDSDLDELSLKPPRKRQKSQDKPVKPKPKPRPKPKRKDIVFTEEPALPSQLSFTTPPLPSSIPALPDLSSPPSSPPEITRKRKNISPLQSEVHGEEMSPILHESGDADIVAASKGKKKDAKLSWAKGKKEKQADRVEPDDLAHKFPTDEPVAGNNDLEDHDFIEEEEPKLTSKKKALSKPTSAVASKPKAKAKGKRFSRKVNMRTTTTTILPRSRSPNRSNHLPEDKDSRDDGPKNFKIPPKSAAAPPVTRLQHQTQVDLNVRAHPACRLTNKFTILKWSFLFAIGEVFANDAFADCTAPPQPTDPSTTITETSPPKKSKKQIEMEERIEEELSETVEGWSCMTDEERREVKVEGASNRAKATGRFVKSWMTIMMSQSNIGSGFAVACSAAVIYDWALNFGQEIELVWRQRFSLMTVLYLSVRYIGILYAVYVLKFGVCANQSSLAFSVQISDDVGDIYSELSALTSAIPIQLTVLPCRADPELHWSGQIISAAMIWMSFVANVMLGAICIAVGVLIAITGMHISEEEVILSGTYQCTLHPIGGQFLSTGAWIILGTTAWEIVVLCFVVRIAVKHFRELRRYSTGGIVGDYFTVLMKSHIVYFAR